MKTLETLTRREREVLAGIAAGVPYKAIACELGISERTVKAHALRIREKLGATNNVQLVLLAIRCELLPAEGARMPQDASGRPRSDFSRAGREL